MVDSPLHLVDAVVDGHLYLVERLLDRLVLDVGHVPVVGPGHELHVLIGLVEHSGRDQ